MWQRVKSFADKINEVQTLKFVQEGSENISVLSPFPTMFSKPSTSEGHENFALCGLYHIITAFNDPVHISPWKTIGEKDRENVVFCPSLGNFQCFSPFRFVVCKCFEFGPV